MVNTLPYSEVVHISRSKEYSVRNVKGKVLKLFREGIKLLLRDNDTSVDQNYGTSRNSLSRKYAISTSWGLSNLKAWMDPIRTSRLRLR
jgi:hypothetical protein